MNCRILILFLIIGLAAEAGYVLQLSQSNPDGVYQKNENITWHISLLLDGVQVPSAQLKYELRQDSLQGESKTIPYMGEDILLTHRRNHPGWNHLLVTALDSAGNDLRSEKGGKVSAQIGSITAPDELQPAGKEPEDFDDFWAAGKKALAEIPMEIVLSKTLIPDPLQTELDCFDVKVACLGGVPVSGYLVQPKNAQPRSLPGVVSFHGYDGICSAKQRLDWGRTSLAFDVNAHGLENGRETEYYAQQKVRLKAFIYWDVHNAENFYFRNMYLRALRALEFLKSRPEWDGRTLIVCGISMGGAQAIAAAGLDPQVTLCVADVPALGDHAAPLEKNPRPAGWPRYLRLTPDGKLKNPPDLALNKCISYFDNLFFARRSHAETLFSAGLTDTVCAPTSVLAAFNSLPPGLTKSIFFATDKGHETINSKAQERILKILSQKSHQ